MQKISLSCDHLNVVKSRCNETILISKEYQVPDTEKCEFLEIKWNYEINLKISRGIEEKMCRKFYQVVTNRNYLKVGTYVSRKEKIPILKVHF